MTEQKTTITIAGVAMMMPEATAEVVALPAPARHYDLIRKLDAEGSSPDRIAASKQGFYTNHGWFVSRHSALQIAREAGQIIRETAPDHGLFSEDVW